MALISSPSHSEFVGKKEFSSLLNKKVMTLPRIEHPSKYLHNEEKSLLNIRGRSRNGQGNGKLIRSERSTPDLTYRRRRSSSNKTSSNSLSYSEEQSLREIPENVNIIYGEDRNKVRLPIFGRRSESTTSSYTVQSDKSSPRRSITIIGELENSLKEKVRSQIHDVRTKFRHAAQSDSNGEISRQALHHLVASIFGTQRQIRPNEIEKLLERLHLKHREKISFDQFLRSLFPDEEDLPYRISRQSSSSEKECSSKRTATQMFLILKEKVRRKERNLVTLCPSLEGGPSSRIFKRQFQNLLIEMGYRMIEKEFDKLWNRFDTDGFHGISSEKFLKRLTNEESLDKSFSIPRSESEDQQASIFQSSDIKRSHLSHNHIQLDEDQIGIWLNHKFPQGFSELERSLEQLDEKQIGTLPRDRFLEEFKRFGFGLEENLWKFFLKRLNLDLTLTNGSIPYRDVIQILKEYRNTRTKSIDLHSSLRKEENHQTALERQVEYLISQNYEKIIERFNRLDSSHHGTINSNDMKSIIEDLLQFPLRPDEYYQLFQHFPIDSNGKIKYKDYFKQLINRTTAEEQKQNEQEKSSLIPQWDYMRSKHIRESLDQEHFEKKKREKFNNFSEDDQRKTRSIEQLRQIIKTIIRDRYKDLEDQFKKVDRASYGELTKDLLHDLFQRLSIQPEITRSEILLLWSHCHLKENGNLDFYQFLREFGYTKRSAHFPNAKENPPKRGDADFLLTSRKLYADSVLVHGAALNAIRSNWDELRREFTQLDPYRTAFIQSEEFDDILTELCPAVNQDDLDILKSKFQTKHDQRTNYVKFLKYHVPVPDLIEEIDQPNRNGLSAINEHSSRLSSDRIYFNELSNKLRRKLSDSYKQLRRTFKQRDLTNSGSVSLKIFKEILSEHKCPLNDEEFYALTSQLDTKMDGTINYNYFIQQYLKNT